MNESFEHASELSGEIDFPVTHPEDVVDINTVSHETLGRMEKMEKVHRLGSLFAAIHTENN